MKDLLEEAVNDYIKKVKEIEDFYESEEFNSLVKIIKRHKKIDQDELRYGIKTIKGLPEEKFRKVVEAVLHNFESELIQDAKDFPTYHVDYNGVRFHLIIGQGSAYWTTLVK